MFEAKPGIFYADTSLKSKIDRQIHSQIKSQLGAASNYLHTNGEMTYVDNRNKSAAIGSPGG